MELNKSVAECLTQKYKLSLILEKEDYLLFDFGGTRIEYNKKIFYLTKLSHQVKIMKINSLKDVDDFMRSIANGK